MTDHTQTQIPDDVMETARGHAKAYYDTRDPKSIQWEFDLLMVARAILKERERCAMIVDGFYGGGRSFVMSKIQHVDK